MANRLIGKRIAIFIEEGYDDQEVTIPLDFLKSEGAGVRIIGSGRSSVFNGKSGTSLSADISAGEARLSDYDAFIVPGGYASERMRLSNSMVQLISDADENGKIIASVGRGPQLLISAAVLKDRMLTCYVGIVIDVINAGAYYVDEPVVRDGNLISSRGPSDLTDFLEAVADALTQTTTHQKTMFAGA